jgi:23S rRNA G2445 N2-methylase RlmL
VHPDLRINVHIDKDQVSVALDTSGNALNQRGYRTATNIAPINEVLAAGILLSVGMAKQISRSNVWFGNILSRSSHDCLQYPSKY